MELALSLPILLLVLTGMFAFGIAVNNYMMLTSAVSIGGQVLSISRGQVTDPCAKAASAVYAAAPLLGQANLSFSFLLNGTAYTGATCNSGTTTTGAAGNLVQGGAATVAASYPCSLGVYGVNLAPGCTLRAKITELVQ